MILSSLVKQFGDYCKRIVSPRQNVQFNNFQNMPLIAILSKNFKLKFKF